MMLPQAKRLRQGKPGSKPLRITWLTVTPGAQAIAAMLHVGEPAQAQAGLQQLAADTDGANDDPWQALLVSLQAIVRGSRDAGLAQDEALAYDTAAETTLLLESLAAKA